MNKEALAQLRFREKFALSDIDSIFEKSPTPSSMSDFSKIESVPKSSNFSTKASFAKASKISKITAFFISTLCLLNCCLTAAELTKSGDYRLYLSEAWQRIPVEESCGMYIFEKKGQDLVSTYVSGFLDKEHGSISQWWEHWTSPTTYSQVGVVRCNGIDSADKNDWNELIGHLQEKKGLRIVTQGQVVFRGQPVRYCVFTKQEDWAFVRAIYFLEPSKEKQTAYLLECYSYGPEAEFERQKPQFQKIAETFESIKVSRNK